MTTHLDNARSFALEVVIPALARLADHCAVGMFGHGSQVLGFDDQVSTDHDFGIQVLIATDRAHLAAGQAIWEGIRASHRSYAGEAVLYDHRQPPERSGVVVLEEWVAANCCLSLAPDHAELLRATDQHLLWLTNGALWHDGPGVLTRLRTQLATWPRAVWQAKLAHRCLLTSINGPYQLHRSLQRGDLTTHLLFRSRFIQHAVELLHCAHRSYAPIPKWFLRSLNDLPEQEGFGEAEIRAFMVQVDPQRAVAWAREVCAGLAETVRARVGGVHEADSLFELGIALGERIPPALKSVGFWQVHHPGA